MTRLLVIRLGALGDILHANASLSLLPPDVDVHWLTSPLYEPLVRRLPRVADVTVWDKRAGWSAYCRLVQQLPRYDGVINWQPSLKTWWLARQAIQRLQGGHVVTYRKQKLPVTGQAVRNLPRRHAIEDFAQPVYQWLSLTGRLIQPKPLAPSLPPPEPPMRFDPAYQHMGLIPGVGHKRSNRALPLAQWINWLPTLRNQTHMPIMWHLFGGADDLALCQQLQYAMTNTTFNDEPVVNHAGRWTILETAALMAQCAQVMGGDTGPTHLAAAVGATVLSPFGPTDARRTGPRGQAVTVVTPDPNLPYWPCEKPRCHLTGNNHLACLQTNL